MSEAVPISIDQIDAWRNAPTETQHLEFKEARTQFEHSRLREYCVALANEGGGHLLLGTTDAPPRAVVGTQAFRDPVSTVEKLYQALGFRVEVHEVNHPQGRVVVFEIPSRPHGTAYHLDGRYLMRSGSALVPMSEDRLGEGQRHRQGHPGGRRGSPASAGVPRGQRADFMHLARAAALCGDEPRRSDSRVLISIAVCDMSAGS